jgi:polyisoprenoid-binding protein YceI
VLLIKSTEEKKDNQNTTVMKKVKFFAATVMILAVGFLIVQCQHEDGEAIPIVGPDPIVRGAEIITCTNCNTNTKVKGSWYHDKSHSSVMWETQYKLFGSKLTGRFNAFFMENLNFDEAHPENISFQGYVRLNTVNTGEPGRDYGCLQGTFKTDTTKRDEPENKAILKSIEASGRYSTTDNGFLVDADFTFLGETKPVTVKMFFVPKYGPDGPSATGLNAGLISVFEITSKDFLVHGSIGDIVRIEINNTMALIP